MMKLSREGETMILELPIATMQWLLNEGSDRAQELANALAKAENLDLAHVDFWENLSDELTSLRRQAGA